MSGCSCSGALLSTSGEQLIHRCAATSRQDTAVRTLLVAFLFLVAFVMIVIVVSSWGHHDAEFRPDAGAIKNKSATDESEADSTGKTHWIRHRGQNLLVLPHHFLVREASHHRFHLVAVDDSRQVYIQETVDTSKEKYRLYAIVDYKQSTETFVVMSRSTNVDASELEESLVLYCYTRKLKREVRGAFATVDKLLAEDKSDDFKSQRNCSSNQMTTTFVGGSMTLSALVAQIVNASCDAISKDKYFSGKEVDERLACGKRLSEEIPHQDGEMCAVDPESLLPGSAMSRGQACRKFRRCNYAMSLCNPFFQSHSVVPAPATLPYCECRKWAEKDAKEIWCPPPAADGGECDTPRRRLQTEQRKLACLCQYKMRVVHPYVSSEYQDKPDSRARTRRQSKKQIVWRVEDKDITAPALSHRSC